MPSATISANHVQPPEPSPAVSTPGGRRNGTFTPGNKGGPGNPFARQTAAMLAAIRKAVTPEMLEALTLDLYGMARKGNIPAAKLVYQYCAGKGPPPVDPDRLDADELKVLQEHVVGPEVAAQVFASVSAGLACTIITATWPGINEHYSRTLAADLTAGQTQPACTPEAPAEDRHQAVKEGEPSAEAQQDRPVKQAPERRRRAEDRASQQPAHRHQTALNGHRPPAAPGLGSIEDNHGPTPNGCNGGGPPSPISSKGPRAGDKPGQNTAAPA